MYIYTILINSYLLETHGIRKCSDNRLKAALKYAMNTLHPFENLYIINIFIIIIIYNNSSQNWI